MLLGSNGCFIAARRRNRLPYDAEVEYLESTGTQWIDTEYNPYNKLPIISFDLMGIGNQSRVNMFGATNTSGTLQYLWLTCGSIAWAYGMGGGYGGGTNLQEYANQRVSFVYDVANLSISINGVRKESTVGSYSNNMPNKSLYLFDCHDFTERTPFIGRIYSCKIWDNGVLVRDFIPVRFTNENGVSEGAMFDRANPTVGMDPDGSVRTDGIYRNAGTGDFVVGPDKN